LAVFFVAIEVCSSQTVIFRARNAAKANVNERRFVELKSILGFCVPIFLFSGSFGQSLNDDGWFDQLVSC
jgi:hypothetical protein